IAITGIGSVDERDSSFLRAGLLTRVDLAALRNRGAAGEMVGRFFDQQGGTDALEINQRVIGIELEDLRHIPTVMAVARGLSKAPAILGALNGRFLNVLVTDDSTARSILALAEGTPVRTPA
ncbi:MAG: sugar-binding transcriptional regulator, partial [Caldilineaceae bacterium]|nr:sugar-binding transcriptional regulator [Caldilineaceae bacterium]